MPRLGWVRPSSHDRPAQRPLARLLGATARVAEDRTVLFGMVVLAISAGALFRIAAYLRARSLWVDEAMLALNIISRPYVELAAPLDLLQSASAGFLWIERAVANAFGTSELALRLPSLIAGLLLLVAVARLAWKTISPQAAVVCTALCASSGTLQYFSNELKPYGLDALATVTLLALALRLRSGNPSTGVKMLAYTAAVLISWISLPAIFTLGAIAVLASGRILAKSSDTLIATVAVVGIASWSLSVMVGHDDVVVRMMKDFWEGTFVGWGNNYGYLRDTGTDILFGIVLGRGSLDRSLIAMSVTVVGFGLLLLGSGSFFRRDRELGVLIVGPLVVGLAASAAGQYPFGDRLWVFALPLIALAIGEGLRAAMTILPLRYRSVAVLAVGGLLWLPSGKFAFSELRNPPVSREHARPVAEEMQMRRQGEPVYVYARALPAFLYYTRDVSPAVELRALLKEASPPHGRMFLNSKVTVLLSGSSDSGLIRRQRGGIDLFGTGSGYHRAMNRPTTGVGDRRWAQQEAGRIARVATRGCAWTFEAHMTNDELFGLEEQLASLGFAITDVLEGSAQAKRWCRGVDSSRTR